jgi:hypothetical protein
MAQSKKSRAASAKIAGSANKQSYFGADATRQSAEKVVRLSNDTVKSIFSGGAEEAQKAQEKLLSITRDSAEKLTKSADTATKAMYEGIAASRDSVETAIQCGNVTAALAKDLSTELFDTANQAFSDSVETAKEFFACRTINDLVEVNNRLFRQASEEFFNRSAKISDRVFEYANDAIEPINERVAHASQQIHKVLKA